MSEFDLIARLVETVAAARRERSSAGPVEIAVPSGDDAAVTVPKGATATSVDSLVDGVHFRRETAPLRSVGRKALAVALSDLAAMGAVPGEAYVQLGVPDDLDQEGCLELVDGLAQVAAEHDVAVLGGDVTRAPVLWVAITVVGHADSAEQLVRRAGAASGQLLCVTGELGGAAAGLLILDRPELADVVGAEAADRLRGRQLEPRPRIAAGRALAATGASAMIDLSDGLGGDANQLAAASGVRLSIELEGLPLQAGVREVAAAAGLDPYDLATGRGEDYELLVALPAERAQRAIVEVEAGGSALTQIGAVDEGKGVALRAADGSEREPVGFDQLRL
jgi:thiamine-monophosphate kinase